MIRSLRRAFVWGCKHGSTLLAVFLVAGYGTTFLQEGPAQAEEAVDTLESVALSDMGMEGKLVALEVLTGAFVARILAGPNGGPEEPQGMKLGQEAGNVRKQPI